MGNPMFEDAERLTVLARELNETPYDVGLRIEFARALEESGRKEDALRQFGLVVYLDPEQQEALQNAERLATQLSGTQNAAIYRRLLVARDRRLAGLELLQAGKNDQALPLFVEAFRNSPGTPDIQANLLESLANKPLHRKLLSVLFTFHRARFSDRMLAVVAMLLVINGPDWFNFKSPAILNIVLALKIVTVPIVYVLFTTTGLIGVVLVTLKGGRKGLSPFERFESTVFGSSFAIFLITCPFAMLFPKSPIVLVTVGAAILLILFPYLYRVLDPERRRTITIIALVCWAGLMGLLLLLAAFSTFLRIE